MNSKKLYKLSQDINCDYDTYDSMVVCAVSEEAAKTWHPSGEKEIQKYTYDGNWCNPDLVKVEYIGLAAPDLKEGVVIASFNAG